jgi:hypothetical protein
MKMMWPQKALADYNIAGRLNALLKPIQSLDEGKWGERHVVLSRNPQLLAGFSLNRAGGFDSILRTPIPFSLVRENRSAQVEVPALLPFINFFPANQQYYSLQIVLGVVPDLFFNDGKYQPSSPLYSNLSFAIASTPWQLVRGRSDGATLNVTLKDLPPDDHFSLMLSIGIRYGAVMNHGVIEQVKYAGGAKVLALV